MGGLSDARGAMGGLSDARGAMGGLSDVRGAMGGLSDVRGAMGGLSDARGAMGGLSDARGAMGGLSDARGAMGGTRVAGSRIEKVSSMSNNAGKVLLNTCMGAMPVVRVEVELDSGEVVSTSAVIDCGSSITLCCREFIDRNNINITSPGKGFLAVTIAGELPVKGGGVVHGLSVRPQNGDNVGLPPVYVVDEIPIDQGDLVDLNELAKHEYLRDVDVHVGGEKIEFLIGNNAPALTEPIDVINAPVAGQPYAVRSRLGWYVQGISPKGTTRAVVGRTSVRDECLDRLVTAAFDVGFDGVGECDVGMSVDDERWLSVVKTGCRKVDSHYEIPLPVRKEIATVPNSKRYTWKRTDNLLKRLRRDESLMGMYDECINDMLEKGYAERVPVSETVDKDQVWYLPHFFVTHPAKPNKLRVVFDCAAKVRNVCLNDLLIAGPKLGNELLDVMTRFREGEFGISGDIEAMFHQVRVPVTQRNYLRFFWCGDEEGKLEEFRMTVHPFGACSSPSVASFALQQIAVESRDASVEAKAALTKHFYVDDCLLAGDREKVIKVVAEVENLCIDAGFKLCKYKTTIVNDREECDVVDGKVLGMVWDRMNDCLRVNIQDKSVPKSKRELLSVIAGVYDPIGMLGPVVLKGRQLLQEMMRGKGGWDENLSDKMQQSVQKWMNELFASQTAVIPRNVLGTVNDGETSYELHVFSDASESGHGVGAYLRKVCNGQVKCSLVLGKSRVNPLKSVSIPRLELVAATLGTSVGVRIRKMLSVEFTRTVYWTDSMTVLAYLRNKHDRFNVFVANRLSIIKARTKVENWRYVDSDLNPADEASRAFMTDRWIKGPPFLYCREEDWPQESRTKVMCDLEIKKVMKIAVKDDGLLKFIESYSSWLGLCRGVAWLLRFRYLLQHRSESRFQTGVLSASEIHDGSLAILRVVQRNHYEEEFNQLTKNRNVHKNSALRMLDPYIDNGLIRVGGRLLRANLTSEGKHPVVVPGKSHVAELLIRECHARLGHLGTASVLGELRQKYWVVRGTSVVKRVLHHCVVCRKVQGQRVYQKMADLPECRVSHGEKAFSNCGLDCFGPFHVKRGRAQAKRYGLIFTCMAMRAIHLEIVCDLSTDGAYNAIRRFLSRRGPVEKFFSDNGTNFIGARKEMMKHLGSHELQTQVGNRGIEWVFTAPRASHHGGAWERLIRVVRRVLESMMGTQVLTDEGLSTLFCEVEMAVNSRPLAVMTADERELDVLSPMKLLTLGNCPVVSGFEENQYSRRRWRQVQYMADLFWRRWRREYRSLLQQRSRWTKVGRNVEVGDIVMLVDENEPRCHWALGKIEEVYPGKDRLVRTVCVQAKGKRYVRPVVKLVLILENEDLP